MKILTKELRTIVRIMGVPSVLLFSAITLKADAVVYAIANAQFGTLNLSTGSFSKISDTPPTLQFLEPGPNHNLLTMSFDGNLDSINPATGTVSVIGMTGFNDCSAPPVANVGNCQLAFGEASGKYYATDFNNNLYTVNPSTGKATFVGKTGIPAFTTLPATPAPDGSFDFYDESLFDVGGKLFANYDAGHFQPPSGVGAPAITETTAPTLYQIDPLTGIATKVADTDFGQVTIADINNTIYSFNGLSQQIDTLDVFTGKTTFVSNYDETLGLVSGVAPIPEPRTIALICCGGAVIAFARRRRRPLA